MDFKKLNLKRYLLGTILILSLAYGYVDLQYALHITVLVFATLVNQFLLVYSMAQLTSYDPEQSSLKKSLRIAALILLKFGILMGAFVWLAMEGRTPLLNGVLLYTFMLINLALSIRKRD